MQWIAPLTPGFPSGIRDNHQRGSVGDFLHAELRAGADLDIVTAYFTVFAHDKLRAHLDDLGRIRLLFGEAAFIKNVDPDHKDGAAYVLRDDGLALASGLNQRHIAQACAAWIRDKVEVRSVTRAGFLHGKMSHIRRGEVSAAIVGSSNFTTRGLGLGATNNNVELNLVVDGNRDRADLHQWFDELWNDTSRVTDVKQAVLDYLLQVYRDQSPEFIYFQTLFELFRRFIDEGRDIEDNLKRIRLPETGIWQSLFAFQKDGAKSAINKLKTYGGCILADSVGLGKTYEALAVIKYFELRMERVLVLCPSKLRGNWELYPVSAANKNNPFVADRFNFVVLTHSDLSRESGRSGPVADLRDVPWGAFDLVVIDESHNFRNNALGNRRPNKLDQSKDVLGRVTLIRDIALAAPHRGHLDILVSLATTELEHPEKKPITDFDTLHAAWEQIFNVELLNKRFYQDLANWYFWALPQVEFPADLEPDSEKRRATGLIRLLTRLIFCWFLKEKELVPDKLFHPADLAKLLKGFDPESETSSTYYHAILQNLFFATLNQRMGKDGKGQPYRVFAKDEGFLKNKATHDINNLYRYESLFADGPDAALALFADVPFLNGGLFECLDRTDESTEKKRYLDGFSRNPKKRPHVPDRLFFDSGETADLTEAYGDKKRKAEKVTGLIHILNRYKFTIVENTPIDQEIALDPELLGKVFENLLASYNEETKTTARKQTGSFYTPRPIVDYMVDESLKAHLARVLVEKASMSEPDARAGLDLLFAYTEREHPFTAAEVAILIAAIDALKILDPACGSGAFPMGVLHKLVYILQKLDPGNERWKDTQLSMCDCSEVAVFEAASVRNSITLFRKNAEPTPYEIPLFQFSPTLEIKDVRKSNISSFTANYDNWLTHFSSKNHDATLIDKIKSGAKRLRDYAESSQGLIPYDKYRGHDEFTIKNRIWHASEKKDASFKPELQGKEVAAYSTNWSGKTWISYGPWLAAPRKQKFFTQERILIREITNPRILAAFTRDEYYNTPSIINITEFREIDPYFLLGILNSRLLSFYHIENSPKSKKGLFPKILVNDVRELPIKTDQGEHAETITKIAREITRAKEKDIKAKTDELERKIDQHVYALYGLTPEEIAIVEGTAK